MGRRRASLAVDKKIRVSDVGLPAELKNVNDRPCGLYPVRNRYTACSNSCSLDQGLFLAFRMVFWTIFGSHLRRPSFSNNRSCDVSSPAVNATVFASKPLGIAGSLSL